MRSPLARPTPAQQARQDAARELGCLACRFNAELGDFQPTGMWVEIHHLLSGGRRAGQDQIIALCHWHHQGKHFPGRCDDWPARRVADRFGPSLGRMPGQFRATYGDDHFLLAFQNRLIAASRIAA